MTLREVLKACELKSLLVIDLNKEIPNLCG